MSRIFEHAVKSVEVLACLWTRTNCQALILAQHLKLEATEYLCISCQKMRIRRCWWQLLQIHGQNDAHTAETLFARVLL